MKCNALTNWESGVCNAQGMALVSTLLWDFFGSIVNDVADADVLALEFVWLIQYIHGNRKNCLVPIVSLVMSPIVCTCLNMTIVSVTNHGKSLCVQDRVKSQQNGA